MAKNLSSFTLVLRIALTTSWLVSALKCYHFRFLGKIKLLFISFRAVHIKDNENYGILGYGGRKKRKRQLLYDTFVRPISECT